MCNFIFLLEGDHYIPSCIETKKNIEIHVPKWNTMFDIFYLDDDLDLLLFLDFLELECLSRPLPLWAGDLDRRRAGDLDLRRDGDRDRFGEWDLFNLIKKRVFFNEIKCYSSSKFIQVYVHCTLTIFENLGNDFPQEGIKFFQTIRWFLAWLMKVTVKQSAGSDEMVKSLDNLQRLYLFNFRTGLGDLLCLLLLRGDLDLFDLSLCFDFFGFLAMTSSHLSFSSGP